MSNERDDALHCLRQINAAACDYNDWLGVGMALKDAGCSCADWDAWSRGDKRYKAGECDKKWRGFNGSTHPVGMGTLVHLCRAHGGTPPEREYDGSQFEELAWDATIGRHEKPREDFKVVNPEWVQDAELPPAPVAGKYDGRPDFRRYLEVLFSSEDYVGYVVEAWQSPPDQDGKQKWMPRKGAFDRTAGKLLELLASAKDLGEVVGDWNKEVGAWIRFNPMDGKGIADENVTAFRFALVESDEISIERQNAIYRQLELPIAAMVHSGGKSMHAIVRIDAPDFKEYQKRVDFLYDVCKKNGLVIDRKNRNPSRLSRMPGVTRNGNPQWLVAVNIGKPTWAEWADWIAAQNDDLPDVECLQSWLKSPPPLADVLIDGILRKGHKMLLTGPANAGKSLALIRLAIAIAEGAEWFGRKCSQGRVLYVNLEVDRASCINRLVDIYKALGMTGEGAGNIDVWNLRGHSQSLDKLAPRLIRRAAKGRYVAVIIDPIYKVLTGDENAAHEMAKFCNQFDWIAKELGTAVVYCHHHSKGAQGGKDAADRASGSGVFKRDPDALLDMVELEITDACRKQLSNRWSCDAMAAALDWEKPDWRNDCPQDDAIVADKLAEWVHNQGLRDAVLPARPPAMEAAKRATGWRIECGTLREFAKFDPIQVWFRYPIHIIDDNSLLADAKADGQMPEYGRKDRRTDDATDADNRLKDTELSLTFATLSAGGQEVTIQAMCDALNVTDDTVRNRLKGAAKRGGNLRFRRGLIVAKNDGQKDTKTEGKTETEKGVISDSDLI